MAHSTADSVAYSFAIDVSTGRARWVRDAGAGLVGGVAVDGNRLYVGTKANRVYQIDAATGGITKNGEITSTRSGP